VWPPDRAKREIVAARIRTDDWRAGGSIAREWSYLRGMTQFVVTAAE